MRRLAAGAALLMLAAACSSPAPSDTASDPATSSTEPIAAPILDEPLLDGDAAVESLCVSLMTAVVEGDDDDEVDSLVRALAIAVRESELGTRAERAEVADELLANGVSAIELLGYVASVGACEELADLVDDLARPEADDPEVLAQRLAEARDLWAASGLGDGDYTLVMFVENSVWFDASEETIGEVECGLFGEWRVLVSAGEVIEARDRFSGCEIDLADGELFWPIPTTVDGMFDYIEGNVCCIQVDFHADLGVPTSVGYDQPDFFLFFGVQQIAAGHPAAPDEILEAVRLRRMVWAEQGSENYRITIRRTCFCPPEITDPYTVTVRDGVVVSVTRQDVEVELINSLPLTVEDLFREVEESRFADSLAVAYHPDLGYPLRIDVDPVINAVDEEHRTIVLDLIRE